MCGIGALFATREDAAIPPGIVAFTDCIRHRGPDDEGLVCFTTGRAAPYGGPDTPAAVYASAYPAAPATAYDGDLPDGTVALLAHRRLSIIDLSVAGHQPMTTPDRRHWIVFNGEIYNYVELRAELERLGYQFFSRTDTEVILAAYREWGRDCLHRFNGMWALVIYDREKDRIFAARDRFGVKPIYYWRSPSGVLAFASEIKQFAALPGWRAVANPRRVYDYLVSAFLDHTEETLFAGVHQLRGGEAVEQDRGALENGLAVYRWYTVPRSEFDGSFDSAAIRFRELFTDAVRLRLRADVPIGSCLSGGLDSSSIVCTANDLLAQEEGDCTQKTFSACSEIPRFDEREYVDEVVRSREVEAFYTYPGVEQLLNDLDLLIHHQDEPFGSTSIYAQWSVFELARKQGITVMLDGQGADEQLCGYPLFFRARLGGLLRSGDVRRFVMEIREIQRTSGVPVRRLIIDSTFYALPAWLRRPAQRFLSQTAFYPRWLDRDMLGLPPDYTLPPLPEARSANDLSLAQLFHTSLPSLLHWEDRNSMAHSIESRVPFLDYRLVEFVLSLPEEYRLCMGTTKRVLRSGLDGVIPDRIRDRRDKMGFVTAEEDWVRAQYTDQFRALLESAVGSTHGLLKEEVIEEFERVLSGQEEYSSLLWRMICLGRWMALFNVKVSMDVNEP